MVDTNKTLGESNERSRIIHETDNQIILDEGNDYKIRATSEKVGGWFIVAIDWEHPNYGYFADAMLCYKSMHMSSWDAIQIVNWCEQYFKDTEQGGRLFLLEKFLHDYPELTRLFDLPNALGHMFGEMTNEAFGEAVEMLEKHGLNDEAEALKRVKKDGEI